MKTVLVTGAAKGIGAAICIAFAKEGYNIALNYNKSEEKAKALSKTLRDTYNVDVLALQADVSKKSDVQNMIDIIIEHFKSIDVLVNNAGVSLIKLFQDTSEVEWNNIISTNLTSIYNTSNLVLPYMIKNHSGSIINISSMWGEVGASCEVAYSASKAGIIGFTKALAKEVGPSNIRVNCVSPGIIDTDMNKELSLETLSEIKEEIPLRNIGTPKNIADAVLFLASNKASYITGQVLSVNGGYVMEG